MPDPRSSRANAGQSSVQRANAGQSSVQRANAGQSSVQLVAVIPALLLAALVTAQFVLAGYALWSAGIAARAGARAAHVGGAPRSVALDALPESLRRDAQVRKRPDGVRVRVEVPSVVPGLPRFVLAAKTALQPEPVGG